jgi:hypothetical protein
MNVLEINHLLKANYLELSGLFKNRKPEFYEYSPEPGKWTAGQHIVHLVQSTKPLLKAVSFPAFILKWKFGKSNRSVRDYHIIVESYLEKLESASDIVSPFSKNMSEIKSYQIDEWLHQLYELNTKLSAKSLRFSESELDTIILPHPLMGKMILREILMWNAYHTAHHVQILKNKYLNT